MKTKPFLIIAAGCLTVYLATHPPLPGRAKPAGPDTLYALPAEIQLDTPEIAQRVERMNRKAEILNKATRQIRRNSVAIERDTRELLNAVKDTKDSTAPAPVDVLVPEPVINASTAPEKGRFWQWIANLFNRR